MHGCDVLNKKGLPSPLCAIGAHPRSCPWGSTNKIKFLGGANKALEWFCGQFTTCTCVEMESRDHGLAMCHVVCHSSMLYTKSGSKMSINRLALLCTLILIW